MSLGASLTSLARTTATSAVRLTWGVVRGVAHTLSGTEREESREARAGAWEAPDPAPVPQPEPAPLRDPVATEPTAASRAEAHGGTADRHADDLYEEAVEEEPEVTVPEPSPDEGVLDPGIARSVRSEAEVMRRAANPVKEP